MCFLYNREIIRGRQNFTFFALLFGVSVFECFEALGHTVFVLDGYSNALLSILMKTSL